MLSFHNIWTVSIYEMKTLLRSWFFRIFSVCAIIILGIFDLIMSGIFNTPWMYRGISSSIPYVNMILLNVTQAVIAIFLASDFLKRDKKLDTTEVIYMRSMTNGDYVLGKTLGILIVFMILNLIVLFTAAVFNIFFSDVDINFKAYIYYPLLITLPSLIFIFGLSFLMMVIIKNQPATFIILLGYAATSLIFFGSKIYFLMDYMTFYLPMMHSDFVGFGNLGEIFIHRAIYLSLGLSFIFATILLIKRLPQSRHMIRFSLIFSIILFCTGVYLGIFYISNQGRGESLRSRMIEINNQISEKKRVSIKKCKIDIKHLGKTIESRTSVVFINENTEPIHEYIFQLNPGLSVSRVEKNGKKIPFRRELHILTVKPESPLEKSSEDSLTIYYSGTIDEEACFVDVSEQDRKILYRPWIFNIDKRIAFISRDYLLLTPESQWYPVSCYGYNTKSPANHRQDFIDFDMIVHTRENLNPISQGKIVKLDDQVYRISSPAPLPGVTLIIGRYNKSTITVDSIEYTLFVRPGHDYFKDYFKEIKDTLSSVIRDIKTNFEGNIELSYPYKKLLLIEVPIQFFSYDRMWTTALEYVQPEMVLLPEKGILLGKIADFKLYTKYNKRWSRLKREVTTPAEFQSGLFRSFVTSTLLNSSSGFRRGLSSEQGSYQIYPNYYTFVNYFESQKWPIFNIILETYIKQRIENQLSQTIRSRFFSGLTDNEKVNIALNGHSMIELLSDPEYKGLLRDLIKFKGNSLFSSLECTIGIDTFKSFLNEILKENRFKKVDASFFTRRIKNKFGIDFEKMIKNWYEMNKLPGFLFSTPTGYKVIDNERTRYQIKFSVSNPEQVSGIIKISVFSDLKRVFMRRSGMEPATEKIVKLDKGETKEIGIVLDQAPRMMTIDTYVSQNIPSVITHGFDEFKLNEKASIFDGEKVLDEMILLHEQGSIVVDNEDLTFSVINPESKSLLKGWIGIRKKRKEKYMPMRWWRPPTRWESTIFADFYGKFIRSAYFTRSGNGDRKAIWKAPIERSGYYDLYYYFNNNVNMPFKRIRRKNQEKGTYQFFVHHDEGVEEILFDPDNSEPGWNFLGSFYLSPDTAVVELTNKSEKRIIFADAIKWIKR